MSIAPSSTTPSSPLSSHHSIMTALSILLLVSTLFDTVNSFSHQSLPTSVTAPATISSNRYVSNRRFLPSSSSSSSSATMPMLWNLCMSSSNDDGDDSTKKEATPVVKCPDCDKCDGSGKILGGIATVIPWFIKAYRPCPVFIARGGNYVRQGQPLDEIAFGRMTETGDAIEDADEYNS